MKLQRVSKRLKIVGKITEIKNKLPIVFCFGLVSPRICISSGMIERLSIRELKSVLIHEQHHLLVHEPAKLFIIKIIAKILFSIGKPPFSKSIIRYYVSVSESNILILATTVKLYELK